MLLICMHDIVHGDLKQDSKYIVMVWATGGMCTAYFWESLHDCTSCMLGNQKAGWEVSLGRKREQRSQILPAGK